jgi:hypothetical protein
MKMIIALLPLMFIACGKEVHYTSKKTIPATSTSSNNSNPSDSNSEPPIICKEKAVQTVEMNGKMVDMVCLENQWVADTSSLPKTVATVIPTVTPTLTPTENPVTSPNEAPVTVVNNIRVSSEPESNEEEVIV